MTTRFKATTLLDLYRDNSGLAASGAFDGYDDDALPLVPTLAGLPAHVATKTIKALDSVTGRVSVVETATARLRPGTDARIGDRVQDTKTQSWFTVDQVVTLALVTGSADVRLEMTRITR